MFLWQALHIDECHDVERGSCPPPRVRIENTGQQVHAGESQKDSQNAGDQMIGTEIPVDVVTGIPGQTSWGRPSFPSVFTDIRRQHPTEPVAVFFCGPAMIASELSALCRKLSARPGDPGFEFRKETF